MKPTKFKREYHSQLIRHNCIQCGTPFRSYICFDHRPNDEVCSVKCAFAVRSGGITKQRKEKLLSLWGY